MSDFLNGVKDASEYLNRTTIEVPESVTVNPQDGTVTAQTQSYSLKEIICSLLAGNGIKLPNLQICLKVNIGRLIPEIPAALNDLKEALEEAEAALDEFIAHTNIDNALGRLNAAVAEFAAIANMINFCGTPVVPRAIPNVLRDSMGSFTGAGKDILDTLGTMADGDIGGCIGADGKFNPDLFTGGLLKQLGDNIDNLLGMPASLKDSILSDLNGFSNDIKNLIEFENNFKGTESNGGSVFAPTTRVNTNVGVAVDQDNMTLSKSQQYANNLQSLYNSLKGYEVDSAGNNIWHYLLEPELIAKLNNDGDPSVSLSDLFPIKDECGRIIRYETLTTQAIQEISVGGPAAVPSQPGMTGLAESGTIVSPPPANTTNLSNVSGTSSSGGGGSVNLSNYYTKAQVDAADQVVTNAFTSADANATADRAAIRSEFAVADAVLQTNIDTNSALITTNATNITNNTTAIANNTTAIANNTTDIATNTTDIATNTADIAALQTSNANPTFTSVTTTDLTVTGTGSVTLSSGNDLELTAVDRVKVTGTTPFKLANMTTTERNAISLPENGDTIYNTTDNKFQGYANGVWVDLH